MIGQTIGHYKIVAKLGEGGMGEVSQTESEILGGRGVAKATPSGLTATSDLWSDLLP